MRLLWSLLPGTRQNRGRSDRPALEDKDVEVRRVAATALGDLKDPAAAPALAVAVENSDLETAKALLNPFTFPINLT